MSASYPLVRNLNAFSTRFGVSAQPFAARIFAELRQQLPDQVLHRPILYLRFSRPSRPTRTRCTPIAPTSRARGARPTSGRRTGRGDPRRLRGGVEARARRLLARRPRAGAASAAKLFEDGIDGGRKAIAAAAQSPRGPFLDGRQHGRARRIVRSAAGHQVPQADQGRARNRAAPRPRVSAGIRGSRAGTLVLQGAAPVRRQPQARGAAPARVAEVQRQQHRLALLSRRAVHRR